MNDLDQRATGRRGLLLGGYPSIDSVGLSEPLDKLLRQN